MTEEQKPVTGVAAFQRNEGTMDLDQKRLKFQQNHGDAMQITGRKARAAQVAPVTAMMSLPFIGM